MKELDNHRIICEFCAQEVKFAESRQVILKIDKTNPYQNWYAMICNTCEKEGKKKTIHDQSIKTVTNINKFKDEESIFEETEEK